jgi:hypothetical protein
MLTEDDLDVIERFAQFHATKVKLMDGNYGPRTSGWSVQTDREVTPDMLLQMVHEIRCHRGYIK